MIVIIFLAKFINSLLIFNLYTIGMKKLTFILVLFSSFLVLHCQDALKAENKFPKYNIGFGGGLDYGGFGGRITVLANRSIGFFGALGYNFLGAGVNAGVDYRLLPNSGVCPYLGVMYGYNASIKVKGAPEYNQTYYGPTFNIGLEFWTVKRPRFFNLELLIPLRSSEFHDDIQNLKNNPNITLSTEPIPVAISLGYHISF